MFDLTLLGMGSVWSVTRWDGTCSTPPAPESNIFEHHTYLFTSRKSTKNATNISKILCGILGWWTSSGQSNFKFLDHPPATRSPVVLSRFLYPAPSSLHTLSAHIFLTAPDSSLGCLSIKYMKNNCVTVYYFRFLKIVIAPLSRAIIQF